MGENALVEERLHLLVREQARQAALEALIEEDRQLPAHLEAEMGPVPYNT